MVIPMPENKKKLLLHVCCAPDASVVLERLAPEFEITIFFYNPNIHPAKEYSLRLAEMEALAQQLGFSVLPADYDADVWFQLTTGMEKMPEGGERCAVCFELRLKKTAEAARQHGFDLFTTVLSVSPHKNANLINQIGVQIAQQCGLEFMPANFKKQNGFLRSLELSRQYNLYRQDYCGCVYSQLERHQAKRLQKNANRESE
jgi:predicted adenine nucleotide alpha hydrolase (AANH) superfamily ATPase